MSDLFSTIPHISPSGKLPSESYGPVGDAARGIAAESPQRGTSEDLKRKARPRVDFARWGSEERCKECIRT